jgi:hypothetical protein
MWVELLPCLTNVVRFPIERRARPSLALLRELAPDVRRVFNIEVFDLEMSPFDCLTRSTPAPPGTSRTTCRAWRRAGRYACRVAGAGGSVRGVGKPGLA